MKLRSLAALLLTIAALCGCATSTDAVLDTVRFAARRDADVDRAQLNPNFRYLRVFNRGRLALLALGNVDRQAGGPVEVWYSAEHEVVRLQNGRLAGAVGLTTEWRSVVLPPLPKWSELAQAGTPYRWTRTRDVMPGYRYGVRDALELRRIDPPERSQLVGIDASQLAWFEEHTEHLPVARYAVELRDGAQTVVYGEQCLSQDVCFSWQRWDAKK